MNDEKKYDPFTSIDEALDIIGRGGMVICTDDEDRENEGDLIMAAETITPAADKFTTKDGERLARTHTTLNRTTDTGSVAH
ncbi:MAG: 3,4-dihydroxy-2-butanone-4-phosphate synthase, partial [bacterium]|nr:3,4-dihydroxy-2-butanone-4-phosphate synthase [bacterium]